MIRQAMTFATKVLQGKWWLCKLPIHFPSPNLVIPPSPLPINTTNSSFNLFRFWNCKQIADGRFRVEKSYPLDYFFRRQQIRVLQEDPFSPYFDISCAWGPIRGREFYLGLRYSIN